MLHDGMVAPMTPACPVPAVLKLGSSGLQLPFLASGLFSLFGLGWLLYRWADLPPQLARRPWAPLPFAAVALAPYVWAMRSSRHLDSYEALDEEQKREEVKRMHALPADVADDLFLGDAVCAGDVARLASLGITHGLCVAGKTAARCAQSAVRSMVASQRSALSHTPTDQPLKVLAAQRWCKHLQWCTVP